MARQAKKSFLFTDEDVVPSEEELLVALEAQGKPDPDNPPAPPPLKPDRREPANQPLPDPNDPGGPPGDPGEPHRHGDEEHVHERDEPGHTHPEHDDQPRQPVEEEDDEDTRSASALHGEISRQIRYEGRIKIVDAWQYPGTLRGAPPYVDRNWVGWGDYDPMRQIEPGPALRVPMLGGDIVMCRPGDYVVTQEVRIIADEPGELKVEVWEQQQFERLFLPVS